MTTPKCAEMIQYLLIVDRNGDHVYPVAIADVLGACTRSTARQVRAVKAGLDWIVGFSKLQSMGAAVVMWCNGSIWGSDGTAMDQRRHVGNCAHSRFCCFAIWEWKIAVIAVTAAGNARSVA